MYEMYPDAWTTHKRRPADESGHPRRRARKDHSVTPVDIARQERLEAAEPENAHPDR